MTGGCKVCEDNCQVQAIDHTQQDRIQEIDVGSVIVATGFKTFDPKRTPYYGYGVYPNVYTALEVERLVNASGPTGGEVILRDGRTPKSIGIIHCVGSRDKKTNRWCSRVCCMYSLKLAHLLKEHTEAELYNFYIDMRTPGKSYEEFYGKLLEEGVQFIRGRVGEVTDWAMTPEEEGKLVIRVEDTLAGFVRRIPVDMVVLSTGLEPQADAQEVRRLFNMSCGSEGFFLERHPKLAPVNTFTDGVFLAGACQGPRDIPDTVAQAGAAAAEAMVLIDRGYIEQEPNTAYILEQECSGCKSCIPLCPYTAIAFDEAKQKAVINEALCKGCGPVWLPARRALSRSASSRTMRCSAKSKEFWLMSKEWKPRIVAFFCNWCTYTAADLAGVSRMKYAANTRVIRLMCSAAWIRSSSSTPWPGARMACSSAVATPAIAIMSRATTRCSAASRC